MTPRTSIATRLFLLVFGFSVAWFTLTTGVQLVLEYGSTRAEVDADLEDLFLATQAGLESSLWNFDLPLVRKALESTRSVRFLSGAQVRDETGAILASWGQVPAWPSAEPSVARQNVDAWAEPLYHQFPLQTVDLAGRKVLVGSLIFISGVDVLALRLAAGFRLILSNYVASTLGLMVILLVGLRTLVSRPLGRMTKAVQGYRFESSSLVSPGPFPRADELSVLWSSFETLTATLRESWLQQRVMSTILEEAAVMALVCDAEGLILSSNAQARTRLAGGVPGGSLGHLTYGGSTESLFPSVSGLLGAGVSWRHEVSAGDPEHPYWLAVALLPLKGADDPRARWGVMIEDISAEKMTDHYRRERDLARESARARSLFLANLSHEIRTPMNAVVGLTSLALGEELSPRVRGYLSPLEQSARVLLGLINDILDFSKLEENKVVLDEVDFDLVTLLEEVSVMTRFRAEEKGLGYTVSLPPGPPPVLRGDSFHLRQVLVNLVSNAVKFTETGEVRLLAAPLGRDRWRFEVTDTGIGIAPADQGRLFESFTQVDPSTTRVYGGTGLGLAIVRQIIGLMGGQVGLDSAPGMGSRFWVEVPIAPGSVVPHQPPADRTGLRGLRVLLAEDNKVNQLVAKEILSKMGVVLTVADNGREACERAAVEPFDLVLMDLQMPVMDGLEATRRLRAVKGPLELPILAMTAHTYVQEREACLEAGMQDLVPKPIEPDDLYVALMRWRPEATRT